MSDFYYLDEDEIEDGIIIRRATFKDGTPIPYCEIHDIAAEVMDCQCNGPKGCKMEPCHCWCHHGPYCQDCQES